MIYQKCQEVKSQFSQINETQLSFAEIRESDDPITTRKIKLNKKFSLN